MLNGPNRAGGAFEDWPGDRRGNHRELFEHQQRFEVAEAKAAILLGQVDAQEPHFGIALAHRIGQRLRSAEHTSELQSLMRISYAVLCLKKKKQNTTRHRQ